MLVSEEELKEETEFILKKLQPFLKLYHSKNLTEVEFTACYIIIYLSHRFPGMWAGASQKKFNSNQYPGISWRELPFDFESNIIKRFENTRSIFDIFTGFALKSTPLAVNRSMINWNQGSYHLKLMFHIPTPREVLSQQKFGKRCVTTTIDNKISALILGQRDALSFTMHDLIHADHFYSNQDCFEGQLGFYGLLDQTFDYFDLSNKSFAEEFEYVISDMNAYAIHLLKCLKAAMIYYFDDNYFLDWARLIKAPVELLLLNGNNYSDVKMDQMILNWLKSYQIYERTSKSN